MFSYSKLRDEYNLNIIISEKNLTRDALINIFKKSKYHISFNLSDGIPNTFLEALFCNSLTFLPNGSGLSYDLPKGICQKIIFDIFSVDYTKMIIEIEINNIRLRILKKLNEFVLDNSINPEKFKEVAKASIKLIN